MAGKYETQSYDVIKTVGKLEVRFYPEVMMVKAQRINGFRLLFGFISGNNVEHEKIAMTTPVYMSSNN